jgi:galactokinase
MTATTTQDELCAAFEAEFGSRPELVVRAPGRVSVLGGHVDYNEGWVMPAAIDRPGWPFADARIWCCVCAA